MNVPSELYSVYNFSADAMVNMHGSRFKCYIYLDFVSVNINKYLLNLSETIVRYYGIEGRLLNA